MGRLRHWLTFEAEVEEQDSDGAMEKVWVDAFPFNSRMPCEVTDLSGRELVAAQAVQSKVTTRIRTRYRRGFTAGMRARAPDGTVYDIAAVIRDPNSRIRWITLNASSGVNEG